MCLRETSPKSSTGEGMPNSSRNMPISTTATRLATSPASSPDRAAISRRIPRERRTDAAWEGDEAVVVVVLPVFCIFLPRFNRSHLSEHKQHCGDGRASQPGKHNIIRERIVGTPVRRSIKEVTGQRDADKVPCHCNRQMLRSEERRVGKEC